MNSTSFEEFPYYDDVATQMFNISTSRNADMDTRASTEQDSTSNPLYSSLLEGDIDTNNITMPDYILNNYSNVTHPLSTDSTVDNHTNEFSEDNIDTALKHNTNFHYYEDTSWIDNASVDLNNESVLTFSTTDSSSVFVPDWTDNFNITNTTLFEDIDSPWLTSQMHVPNLFINGNTRIDTSAETVVKVFVLALVSIFGSIGNFLVVGSVIKSRHLHRPPFYFLLSMGVTDLARAGFCLPVVMATALQGSIWRHGPTACKMFAFASSFFVFSSALSLLTIAVERHVSIVYSKAYRRRCHGFINLFATLFIWATAFCISFPPVFAIGAGEYVFISEEAQCAYAHKHYSHNDGLNSVLFFIAITSLTYFLYYRIFIFMRSHRRMRPLQHRPAFSSTWTFVGPGANGQAFINWLNGFGGNTTNYARQASTGHRSVQRLNFGRVMNLSTTKNEHLTRLFLIMTLVYGITWLPYVILSLWRVFLDSSKIPASFMTYAAWLSYSQVALCPLTYFLSRGRIRNTSRIVQMDSTERSEFLLENKIGK